MPLDPRTLPAPASDFGYAAIEVAHVEVMLSFLARLRPHTGSEALRALREAFPTAPLAVRVDAMTRYATQEG
jgi:hypothetical protein